MERFELGLKGEPDNKWKGPYKGPVFTAQYDGACGGCSNRVVIGESVQYIGKFVCHVGCTPSELDEYDRNLRNSSANHGVGYTISGARKPSLCDKCHTEHAGQPGEDCF